VSRDGRQKFPAFGVANSRLSPVAGAMTSCGSEMSAGVILFVTSAAAQAGIRSTTLKMPFPSHAMFEKLARLPSGIAGIRAHDFSVICPICIDWASL
jgi:hypothetical protein